VVLSTDNWVYVYEPDGSLRSGFPNYVETAGTTKTPSPALADMSNPPDGKLDIVVASTNGGVYVFKQNGSLMTNWINKRYSTMVHNASESSPVVADINGDGLPDVIIGGEDGRLAALSNNGTMLPGFPIILDGEVRGTPAVADIDGDGMTEIALAGWDKLLHVWDYDFPFSPQQTPPWPQFMHDARRTGLATNLVFTGVDDKPASLPTSVEFAIPQPNPAKFRALLHWAIPEDRKGEAFDLSLFDVNGRHIRTVASGSARPGRFSQNWDLRDDAGQPARTGVYFARLKLGASFFSHKLVIVH
jgi:hypothetical protein